MANTATTLYPHGATQPQMQKINEKRREAAQQRRNEFSKLQNGFVGAKAIDAFFRRTPLLGC
jgi:hypothetical protein